jgi:hypothetical protein
MHVADVKDFRPLLEDFSLMCDEIGKNPIKMTPKNGFTKKFFIKMNKELSWTDPTAKDTWQADRYVYPMTLVQAAIGANLLVFDEAGSKTMILGPKFKLFKKLNPFSQYFTLFHSWYCEGDLSYLYSREDRDNGALSVDVCMNFLYFKRTLKRITNKNSSKCSFSFYLEYSAGDLTNSDVLNFYWKTLQALSFFRIVDLEVGYNSNSKFAPEFVNWVQLTPLGASIISSSSNCRYCSAVNRYSSRNAENWRVAFKYEDGDLFDPETFVDSYDDSVDADVLMDPKNYLSDEDYDGDDYEDEDDDDEDGEDDENEYATILGAKLHDRSKTYPSHKKYCLEGLLQCFPKGSLQLGKMEDILKKDDKLRVFEIKATYEDSYRVIRCKSTHTFEDLHYAIQEAFALEDDHLYCFYPKGKKSIFTMYSSEAYNMELYASDMKLGDIYPNGPIMEYLFDFGERYLFDLSCKVSSVDPGAVSDPEIIKKVGDDIQQYHFWDLDEEYYEDFDD